VVFVDHNQPELQEAAAAKGQWRAAFEHQSKVNMHEVDLAAAVVRYMLQQGYAPSQLVVLTPYLGQLLELQRALSREVEVVLADMDVRDLRKAALPVALADLSLAGGGASSSAGSSSASASVDDGDGDGDGAAALAPAGGSGVRAATIDNFQGEEGDIVIASLVRCNAAGKVGFLREPERINVLLSRARQGLILLGSSATLLGATSCAAREPWGVVLRQLQQAGQVHPGLPVVCQQHSFALPMPLDSSAAFRQHAPDGGCMRPCLATLPCGHACPLRCHAFDTAHKRVRCPETVYDICPRGHLTVRACSDVEAPCTTCVEIQRLQEREQRRLRELVSAARGVALLCVRTRAA
jgi:hypothetical protein